MAWDTQNSAGAVAKYFIRSTILGGEVISQAKSDGGKAKTFVRAAGVIVAEQKYTNTSNGALQETLNFTHTDASGMSVRTLVNGTRIDYIGRRNEESPAELDPTGNLDGLIISDTKLSVK